MYVTKLLHSTEFKLISLIFSLQTHSNSNLGIIKRSRRKNKTQKSESEEYDSLSDTESGSGDHIRSRIDQSMHLDDHEPSSFIREYMRNANEIPPNIVYDFFFNFSILLFADKTPHKIMVNYRL